MKRQLVAGLLASAALVASAAAQAASYKICNTTSCASESVFAWPWEVSTYSKTKFPIVLAHGMAGFSKIGPLDYWYGIPQELAKNGASVYVTQVASFHSSEARGEQLLSQVKMILAITGAPKVNLIGHSHGSHSIRYVAGVLPTRIASATAVGGPNGGSPVADVIQGATSIPGIGPIAEPILAGVVNGFFSLVDILSGQEFRQDALAGLASLSTSGSAAFTQRFPAGMPAASNRCAEGAYSVNGVRYFSWSGTGHLTNVLDPVDLPLGALGLVFPEANDGLVGRCSSHLGKVIRDNYFMNHLDEVNQIMGLTSIFETDPKSVFRAQANRLKNLGL
ncbi:MAG: triacylglycerol lipase [Moraxellaceae bacterium]|jgi:triacylglycerol lipase|nr:triacylglycerol lipase [Moraxellaceae bacterium]